MKIIEVIHTINRRFLPAVFTLLAVMLVSANSNQVMAQSSDSRAIDQAQASVRQQIISQESRRDNQSARRTPTVRFNDDAQTTSRSNNQVQVRGTGTFLNGNDSRNNNQRNNNFRGNRGNRGGGQNYNNNNNSNFNNGNQFRPGF